MVGDLVIEAEAEEPQVIQSFRDNAHQLALALHVVEEEQEQQLQDDDRIDQLVAVIAVERCNLVADPGEIDRRRRLSSRTVVRPVQGTALTSIDEFTLNLFERLALGFRQLFQDEEPATKANSSIDPEALSQSECVVHDGERLRQKEVAHPERHH